MSSGESYNHNNIESKWREYWTAQRLYEARDDDPRPKYYCLDMFPYPSGSGLHVGHWRSYVLPDCWSRYKILQGFNVWRAVQASGGGRIVVDLDGRRVDYVGTTEASRLGMTEPD